MDINLQEQIDKLKGEAQAIGGKLAQVQQQESQLAQAKQQLINEAIKNQGALDLLNSLNEEKQEEEK